MTNNTLKKILLFTLTITYISCHFEEENGITVEIKNSSQFELSNIRLYTSDEKGMIKFDRITSGQTVEKFLDMKNVHKSDGAYTLEFIKDDKVQKYISGYYTNGSSLESKVEFDIKNDTIFADFKTFSY